MGKRLLDVWTTVILCAVAAAGAGCDGSSPPVTEGCPDGDKVFGVCAGAPAGELCDGDPCTEGVSCGTVVSVDGDADLQSKAKSAGSGTCLALAPGSYPAVTLPGGVSLLGRSAELVTVSAITLSAGSGAVVRGLTVGAGGVEIQGATGVRIESVRVAGSSSTIRDGVSLGAGSQATIVTSTIDGAGRAGVYAMDADVTLDRSLVSGAQSAGVWVEGTACDASCNCTERPLLTVRNSTLRQNASIGVSLTGAAGDILAMEVMGTQVGASGFGGGGVAATACSDVAASQVRVNGSSDYGVLVDRSTARLGDAEDEDGTVEIGDNLRGLWIQNVDDKACPTMTGCVTLHRGTLEANLGVGIGVAGSSRGVILCKTAVTGTLSTPLSVFDAQNNVGKEDVGDGVSWLDKSSVVVEEVILGNNERQSLLIDGPVAGDIVSLELRGGDANKPPLQQNLPMGGAQPTLGGGVDLTTDVTRKLAIPGPLTVPAPL